MIHRSFILETLVDLVVRTALVFSLFLLFSGHNSPGGGFVAGLVVGITLMLGYVSGGIERAEELLPVPGETMLAVGLSLVAVVGMGGFVWGDAFLETAFVEVETPILGAIKTTSALPFDIGVFAVVVGLVASLIAAFGAQEDVS